MPNPRTLNALGASMMLFLTSLAVPGSAAAQERVSGFAVVARVDSVQLRGDTVRLVYVVHNSAGSSFSLTGFIVRTYLTRTCGELRWIDNRGLCTSLEAKLDASAAALARGNPAAARRALLAFLEELSAQSGVQPGKHVTMEAYALLSVNARQLLATLH
jgi:hypothetical protein